MQDTTFLLTASTEICEDTFRQKKKSMDNKHGGNWGQIFADAPNVNIDTIRTELEGPTPLRVMAALGGLATTAAASLGLVNLPALFLSPARYLLQCYMAIFGLLVVLIEMKSLGPGRSDRYKAFIYRWLPFTSVVGGKGISYIFLGKALSLNDVLKRRADLFVPLSHVSIS